MMDRQKEMTNLRCVIVVKNCELEAASKLKRRMHDQPIYLDMAIFEQMKIETQIEVMRDRIYDLEALLCR